MSETTDHTKHLPAHEETYGNFIKGSIALSLYCAFILVALCSFAFGATLNNVIGWVILIVGLIAVLIDLRAGGRWILSGGLLVAFGLLTGINVS
ncbi:MAG: hypothetical protein HKN11_16650 [Rhizobiales bacterium]|nr:hypothetical protein [Hyphomicrobiales bacterium]